MKIIKVISAAAVCLVLMSALPVNVCADVIMVPEFSDIALDPFKMESVFIEYRYYNVIKDCNVMSSPESNEAVHEAKKGEQFYIYRAYTDEKNVIWGLVDEFKGWINMANLEVIYDTFSFEEDHSKELKDYAGELDSFSPSESVYLWSFPMSSEVKNVISKSDWEYLFISESDHPVYTDENGNKWINIDNSLGWVFLNAPGEKEIMTETTTETEKTTVSEASETTAAASSEDTEAISESEQETSADASSETTLEEVISEIVSETSSETESSELPDETTTENAESSENNNSSSFVLPIILAVSAAAVSAILLFALKKKPDNKD